MMKGERGKLKSYYMEILPLAVLGLAVLFIYRRLVAGRVLAGGDLHMYFFPYWTAAARAFQAGRVPLWSPHLFTGVPLLANSQVGVAYPLNWPLWCLSGPTLAGMARTLHWNVLLHISLAAFTTYVLARRLGVHPWGAALSGLLYAGGGYVGLHLEHLNQLQALAWLPLVLLPQRARAMRPGWLNVMAFAMILLSGHTQMAFIAGVGLLLWWLGLFLETMPLSFILHPSSFILLPSALFRFFFPFIIAVLIATVQLLPTFELMGFSMRSGGLPWREAVSFSIRPWDLPEAVLPPYLLPPLLPEGVAYIGLVGLGLAAVGFVDVLRTCVKERWSLILLIGGSVFLALGGYNPLFLLAVRVGVPGLVHFRAPARFLALYVLVMVVFAGYGASWFVSILSTRFSIDRWGRYVIAALLALVTLAELTLASEYLPHASATALRAYTDVRPAMAHLIAATQTAEANGDLPDRFLSISKTLFDAGDETAMAAVYGETLSDEALWAYQVAAKHREVLSPNLSLAFEVPAVDGYDGGVLPLRHYVAFSRLLLPDGTLDGRLRENLTAIPDVRWLSLLGVRFVITDKTGDAWADDVFYDRQFQTQLADGASLTLAWLPGDFTANAVGLLYTGVGFVDVTLADGQVLHLPLSSSPEEGYRVRWARADVVNEVTLRAGEGGLHLSGASLIDERTGAFYPLTLSAYFRQVHSGDVKIYENLAVLPRLLWMDDYVCVDSDEDALAQMQSADFDPVLKVLLHDCGKAYLMTSDEDAPRASVALQMVHYASEQIVFEVTSDGGGLVVLSDAWYPGWRAHIEPLVARRDDDTPRSIPVLRADLLFRAVPLPAGQWKVTLTYHPKWVSVGGIVCLLGVLVLVGYAVYQWWGMRVNIH